MSEQPAATDVSEPTEPDQKKRRITRRQFLIVAGASGAAALVGLRVLGLPTRLIGPGGIISGGLKMRLDRSSPSGRARIRGGERPDADTVTPEALARQPRGCVSLQPRPTT